MDYTDITAVIIAGGKGSRLGGVDKGLMLYQHKPFIVTLLERIQPQVAHICINANRNQTEYAQYGYPVFSDDLDNYQGPLAGIATAMKQVKTDYMVILPCDAPCLPDDFVARLIAVKQQQLDIVVAHDGERPQFLHALLPVALQDSLQCFLQQGKRGVGQWYRQHSMVLADFSDNPAAFINVNTIEQRQQLALLPHNCWAS